MQLEFTGKRVLVTCGAEGIGRAAVQAFHGLGARVAIQDREPGRIGPLIDGLGADERLLSAPGALSSAAQIRKLVAGVIARLGGLDILVNCGPRGELCPIDRINEENWTRVLSESLKSVFFTAQACVPSLEQSKGCIVNVASSLGLIGGPAGSAAYTAVQHGIVQMTKIMALELGPSAVRVNAVAAGWIEDQAREAGDGPLTPDAVCFSGSTPMGRSGRPDEAAAAVVCLASAMASFTTGAVLAVDGGVAAGRYA